MSVQIGKPQLRLEIVIPQPQQELPLLHPVAVPHQHLLHPGRHKLFDFVGSLLLAQQYPLDSPTEVALARGAWRGFLVVTARPLYIIPC